MTNEIILGLCTRRRGERFRLMKALRGRSRELLARDGTAGEKETGWK